MHQNWASAWRAITPQMAFGSSLAQLCLPLPWLQLLVTSSVISSNICQKYSFFLVAKTKWQLNLFLVLLSKTLISGHFPGYGNMSPSSTAGQIFCVFFALFGIPLNVVVLNRVGKYMLVIVKNISTLLEGKTKHEVRRSFANLALRLPCLCFVITFFFFKSKTSALKQGEQWEQSDTGVTLEGLKQPVLTQAWWVSV